MSDGARLAEHGKYIEPSPHRHEQGLYDIPYLSKELNQQLLLAHGELLGEHWKEDPIELETLERFFTKTQLIKQLGLLGGEPDKKKKKGEEKKPILTNISMMELLQKGSENMNIAAPVYSCIIHILMEQKKVPFLVVLDEFNVYYKPKGHYFHGQYENANKHIPYDQITLFQPFLSSFESMKGPQRGVILASTTHSRPVPAKVTKNLTKQMNEADHVKKVEVMPFSKTEIDRVIANYECIGVGKLRFDEGKTLGDEQEMAFLRMHSGGIGSKLLDGIIF